MYVRKKCLGLSDYFPVLDLPLGINDPYRPFCLYSFLKTCLSNSQWAKKIEKYEVRNSNLSPSSLTLIPRYSQVKGLFLKNFFCTFFALLYLPCFKVKKNRTTINSTPKTCKRNHCNVR